MIQRLNRALFGPRKEVDEETGDEDWTQAHRFGSCGLPLGGSVAVGTATGRDGVERAIFTGVETCGSATACLRCAAKVRAERALHISKVVRDHLAAGGFVLFATLTASHTLADSLGDSMEAVTGSWDGLTRSKRWARFKQWAGVTGYIRTLEITRTEAAGWHPHYHVVLLTDRPIGLDEDDPGELPELRDELSDLWSFYVEGRGRDVHGDIGVDLVPIRDGEGLGEYVSKLALECARGDLKRGRGESRSPWQIALSAAQGDHQAVALWVEYVEALKSRQWITTSRGLWERFDVDERSDEEIAEDRPDDMEPVFRLAPDVYRSAERVPALALVEVRQLVETGSAPELVATVLSRRLARPVEVVLEAAAGEQVPILRFRREREIDVSSYRRSIDWGPCKRCGAVEAPRPPLCDDCRR